MIPRFAIGLEEMVESNYRKGSLTFSTDLGEAIRGCEAVVIVVGKLQGEDGLADWKCALVVAQGIGEKISDDIVVITKNAVPVGDAEKVCGAANEVISKRDVRCGFDVASNPEFLKVGAFLEDFMKPDHIVVGVGCDQAQQIMDKLYCPFSLSGHPGTIDCRNIHRREVLAEAGFDYYGVGVSGDKRGKLWLTNT